MSRVTCHMSCVTCHMSHVACHISKKIYSYFLFVFLYSFFRQGGGASWWRVCYQRGLPRLVYSSYGGFGKQKLKTIREIINIELFMKGIPNFS